MLLDDRVRIGHTLDAARKALGFVEGRTRHGYFDVDMDIVWQIVTGDLPALVSGLEQLLSEEGEG